MTEENIKSLSDKWSSCTINFQIWLIKRYDRIYSVRNKCFWLQFLANEFDKKIDDNELPERIVLTEEELFLEEMEQVLSSIQAVSDSPCSQQCV